MRHIYICPDCRAEHYEPARADFILHAICLDCALRLEIEAAWLEPAVVAAAA